MLSDESYAEFSSRAKNLGLDLKESELKAFERYYNELCEYNSHTNLVANTDEKEVYIKHFLDSLAFSIVEEDNDKNFSLLDFGCGGGFPGVGRSNNVLKLFQIGCPFDEFHDFTSAIV